jgi:uncharacterized protein
MAPPRAAKPNSRGLRVLVAGASGLIGRGATKALLRDGHRVVGLSRHPSAHEWPDGALGVAWDGRTVPPDVGAIDAIVSLTGERVDQRWTAAARQRLHDSRVGVNEALAAWVRGRPASARPRVVVTASAAGYYGLRPSGTMKEEDAPGTDFLATLCKDWEATARSLENDGVRVVALRFAIVLHPKGGALRRMLLPFRLGLGGPVGNGRQPFPWVHRDDAADAVAWAVRTEDAGGAYNVAAPQAVDMRSFAKSLAATLQRPAFARVPGPVLRALYGRGPADVLMGGQDLSSDRLLKAGFRFRHADLSPALRDLLP